MAPDRIVVSNDEIEQTIIEAHAPPAELKRLPSPIPLWARIALSLLVPILPVLCFVAIVLRLAFRAQPPRDRSAMTSFLLTLVIISGFLTTIGVALVLSSVPVPAIVNTGLPDLDERTDFPALAPGAVLTSAEVSSKLKSLVIVVSPTVTLWSRQEIAGQSMGAGMLLEANQDGYLFATANHVATHAPVRDGGPLPHVMVTTASGVWSTADVIGSSAPLDLALLWVPRHSGEGKFSQPISKAEDGEPIFVIGHPEGLKYTLSTGLVSGLRDQIIQISAAISPGNSGGPVYDNHGDLIGIVSAKVDRNLDANAENLGFAAQAEMLRDPARWSFYGTGRQKLETYLNDLQNRQASPPPVTKQAETKEER
jgi:S1-C subfamily serine protease